MKHPKLNKALLKFQGECGQVEQKLQPRISFGEVSVGYYPADGLCAVVTINNSDGTAPLDDYVVKLSDIPEKGEITQDWWCSHSI